jgi:2,3,4,5-tetrahydropyridine-2,6-dicarboxylate N-succinyltransferase
LALINKDFLQGELEKLSKEPSFDASKAKAPVEQLITLLNLGQVRAAENLNGVWKVNDWVRSGILLAFKVFLSQHKPSSEDKMPHRVIDGLNVRVVPTSCIRDGVFLGPRSVVMPSFLNIGAYIGSGTMIDSYVTVGSCAQIGDNCHISSSVVIAGVLEPPQSLPVIIESGSFIGAGSVISEGVIVREGSVIASGVILTSSTRIVDRVTGSVSFGEVPPYCVVAPGSFKAGSDLALNCAVVVKRVDAATRRKVGINELLRE